MPKHLTWETPRERWIFQIRIPSYARSAFDGRTTIRHHLGNIPEAEAIAHAHRLASQYKALFARCRHDQEDASPPPTASKTKLVLVVDKDNDIGKRLVATWLTEQVRHFEERLVRLRKKPREDWDRMTHEVAEALDNAQEALRQHDSGPLREAMASLETRLKLRFEGYGHDMDVLVQVFNSQRVTFLSGCLAILRGERSVHELYPDPNTQLPILGLWGDPASRLTERWQKRIRSVGGYVNPKTLDKYREIADDLGRILDRRPVQALVEDDLASLKKMWIARGNGTNTIADKLRILLSLLRPFDPDRRLEPLFTDALPAKRAPRAARLPFTDAQIRLYFAKLYARPSVREDDRMLVMLLFLLSSRIEEVYQLLAEDFEPNEKGWIVRIADHRQTRSGNTRLKNAVSARRLPLHSKAFPEFHAWLTERIRAGGHLFPDGNENQYGTRSAAASKRLNRLLRKLFPDDRRLVLQSIRSTANRTMRRAGVDPRIRHRFLGHADHSVHDRHYDPSTLLDADDLKAGSTALTHFLLDILRAERTPSVQTDIQGYAGSGQDREDVFTQPANDVTFSKCT